jgi:cellulose synthase/poly-beta-1,6-N-acetylglucosamine synthase-like glycosyltransferase
MCALNENFLAASPRHGRITTPAASWIIHGAVLAFFVMLFTACLHGSGALAWGPGLAYVAYDTVLLGFTAVQTSSLVRGPPSSSAEHASATRASIGVVVAAHNEAAVLPKTLATLLHQTDRPDAIVVADDGSDDTTNTVLASYGLANTALDTMVESSIIPGLFWLRLPRGGKARALNDALQRVATDLIVTVDADTWLEPDAVGAFRAAFSAEPALVAATGVLTPICARDKLGSMFQWFQTYEYIRNFLGRFAWMRADGLLLISGACAGFRRDAVLAVGGFDPDCLVEDYELIHRLRRHASLHNLMWRTRVLGGVRARTEAPGTPAAFLRQRRRWFGGFLQTQFWYRDMVGNPFYGRLGTWMLPVKAADTLQPIYGLTAFALLLWYLARGDVGVLLPVSGVIGAKIGMDLGFQLWSVRLYRRWTGDVAGARFFDALLAALVGPFCFQPLRHAGAALGWVMFLTGARNWGQQTRTALAR